MSAALAKRGAASAVPLRVARARIEAEIERLIALLDAFDGDPDLEPSICGGFNPDRSPVLDDREGGDPLDEGEPNDWDGEDGGDEEPSLGWCARTGDRVPIGWGYSASGHGGDADE